MTRTDAFISALAVSLVIAACGGGGGSSGGSTAPPSGGGGTTTVNPCSTALEADQPSANLTSGVAGQAGRANKKTLIDGNPRGRVYEAMWINRAAQEDRQRGGARQSATVGAAAEGRTGITTPAPVAEDIGEIAIVQDSGDLILPAHTFDLVGVGLRFTRNGSNGYSVAKIDGNFRANLGSSLTLGRRRQRSRRQSLPVPLLRWRRPPRSSIPTATSPSAKPTGQHRAQHRAAADRPAARRAVPRRSRSDRRRQGLRQRRGGPVHRHLVRRARVRLDRAATVAGDAVARRQRSR